MGRILVSVAVGSFGERAREITCDALVDTGAYCLTLRVPHFDLKAVGAEGTRPAP